MNKAASIDTDVLFDKIAAEIRELYYSLPKQEFAIVQSAVIALLAGTILQ